MIPEIIHHTWKSKVKIPRPFQFWRESFFECNPGIEHRLYDDFDNREVLEQTFPELLDLYQAFPKEIYRVDFIRPLYLFKWGGVYADMDFQCLKPFSAIFSGPASLVLGKMGTDDSFPHSIPNALMASSRHQGFWLGYIANIEHVWSSRSSLGLFEQGPDCITGSIVLRKTVLQYCADRNQFKAGVMEFIQRRSLKVDPDSLLFDDLELLPSHVWYPLSWNDQIHLAFRKQVLDEQRLYSLSEAQGLFPNSMAVTYWSHSWSI